MNILSPILSRVVPIALVAAAIGGATFWIMYDDWVTLPKARKLVADRVIDPTSILFRNDRLVGFNWHCGEFNSKNRMGAYTGYEKFISGRQTKTLYIESEGMVGDETTEEVLLVMAKVNARMEKQIKLRDQTPGMVIERESMTSRDERGRREVFQDHWANICEVK